GRQIPATTRRARIFGAALPPRQTAPQTPPGSADSRTGRGCKATCRRWAKSAKRPSKPRRPSRPALRRKVEIRIRLTPAANSPPATKRWRADATKKRPTAAADVWPEPKKQSDSDTTCVPRAPQKTQHWLETSWDSGSSEPREGRSPNLPHKDDNHESEAQRRSTATIQRYV